MDYYRFKSTWTKEDADNGGVAKVKTEDLISAESYTEAEKIAYQIIESQNRTKLDPLFSFEIIKTNIRELLYNPEEMDTDETTVKNRVYAFFTSEDAEVGIYAVDALIYEDDDNGEQKSRKNTLYVAAPSSAKAQKIAVKKMSYEDLDYIIRAVKFDKAKSIVWTSEEYGRAVKLYDTINA